MGSRGTEFTAKRESSTRCPPSGLTVKWRKPIQGGYAGPAVAAGRVFVFDYQKESGEAFNDPGQRANLNGKERLIALDAESGEETLAVAYDCPYSISYPAGPRCTPTVDGDFVYILGSEGDLKCLAADDGNVVWSRSLKQRLRRGGPDLGLCRRIRWSTAISLYTMVGGKGQGIVAFDKRTGEVRWKALDAKAGYCPPSIIEAGGTRQLIVFHPDAVVSLDPQTATSIGAFRFNPLTKCRSPDRWSTAI